MGKIIKRIKIFFFLIVSVFGIYPTASGLPWTEIGDAQMLPIDAQEVIGAGTLDAINGQFSENDHVDMYKIFVKDSGAFSAVSIQTSGPNPQYRQLFLFDSDGLGILGNDNTTGDAYITSFNSQSPGIYYIATSLYNIDPSDSLGYIFPNMMGTEGQLVYPLPRNEGLLPVEGWSGSYSPRWGSYTIAMQGADFISENQSPVPEPTTILLLSSGLIGLVGFRRKLWQYKRL